MVQLFYFQQVYVLINEDSSVHLYCLSNLRLGKPRGKSTKDIKTY
jgi:hypothetical protein